MSLSATAIDFMEQFEIGGQPLDEQSMRMVVRKLKIMGLSVTKPSVLQDWVMELPGLRHQGVLLTAIRGCDTAPKNDSSKLFTRCLRAMVLNAFVGDAKKAATFIEVVPHEVLIERFNAFRKNLDHYPHHYVMHLTHAIEVIGYHHPDELTRDTWRSMYQRLAIGLHMQPETMAQMDHRLTLCEEEFGKKDKE